MGLGMGSVDGDGNVGGMGYGWGIRDVWMELQIWTEDITYLLKWKDMWKWGDFGPYQQCSKKTKAFSYQFNT